MQIRFATIKRVVDEKTLEVDGLGGKTKERYIMTSGTGRRPKPGDDCIVFSTGGGSSEDIIIPIQAPMKGLADGDFKLDNGAGASIHMSGGKITIKASEIVIEGDSITHGGKEIGKDHKHTGDSGGTIEGVL